MAELTGNIKGLNIDFASGKAMLTLEINEKWAVKQAYDDLISAEKLSIQIDKYRDKRTLEANRYMWKLCGELAEKLSDDKTKHTKESVYRKAIKEIGVWADDEIEPDKVQWRRTAWEQIGTGWITERVDFTADGSKEIIRFYYGSSRYNKKQMSRLIDNIVQDCEALGIQTKTPDEIERLKSLWGE